VPHFVKNGSALFNKIIERIIIIEKVTIGTLCGIPHKSTEKPIYISPTLTARTELSHFR
jgi:hypothetical protein